MLVSFGYSEKWEDQDSVFILGGRCLLSFETLEVLGDLGYLGKNLPSGGLKVVRLIC